MFLQLTQSFLTSQIYSASKTQSMISVFPILIVECKDILLVWKSDSDIQNSFFKDVLLFKHVDHNSVSLE